MSLSAKFVRKSRGTLKSYTDKAVLKKVEVQTYAISRAASGYRGAPAMMPFDFSFFSKHM